MRRYQLVWWWNPRDWTLAMPGPYRGPYTLVYAWGAQLGPLEVRKWRRMALR